MSYIIEETSFDRGRLNEFYNGYISLFEPTTDAPVEFIFTALLPALGALISLNRWIEWGTKKIYPNIWTILVAPSTHMRKSTALNDGLYFNRCIGEELPERQLILPNDGSFAALIKCLEYEKQGVIKHSELASFLENMSKGFNCNMKSLMTDFFDVPQVHQSALKSEEIRLEQPIFSMSTATTLNWLKQKTSNNDIESGFLARFLYCFRDSKTRSVPIPEIPNPKIRADLLAAFKKLLELEPRQITFDNGFKEVYEQCYAMIDECYRDPFTDDGTKALIGRLQTDYFIKLSIIECVLNKTPVAGAEIATRVSYLIKYYLSQASKVMGAILQTKRSINEEKVLAFLGKKKEATKTELHDLFNRNLHADNLEGILKSLIAANLITETKSKRTSTFALCGSFRTENE